MNICLHYFHIPSVQHPMFAAVPLAIAGICAQHVCSYTIACAIYALIIAFFFIQTGKYVRLIIFAISIFLFFSLRYAYQADNHINIQKYIAQQKVLRLTIVDKDNFMKNKPFKELLVTELCDKNTWFNCPWLVHLYLPQKSSFLIGDVISVFSPKIPTIQDADFNAFLRKENIATILFLSKNTVTTLYSRPEHSLIRSIWLKQSAMLQQFRKHLSESAYQLTSCIFWGNRSAIKQTYAHKQLFKKCGIVHHLARSGLHLVIFVYVMQCILRLTLIPLTLKQITLLVISFLYYLFSWTSISFYRALALSIFYILCSIFSVRSHTLYLLSLVCVIQLAINPMQLFFLDFQLTFGLTYALCWHSYINKAQK